MPYITQKQREELNLGCIPKDAGELNYCIHLLLAEYMKNKKESYQTYNDILGALEGAKLELYRRRINRYEDIKKELNGDIDFYKLD